ncbi:MAG TPA: helix-turn-helix transcriptional regulator [Thermoanaerobaculia bacterium]|nr:helix-turn-helix transcriptional regulator [Thermoanaerobaculia bacterium]
MRFRDAVATELERRRCGQPRYSLRRFARTLGVHHSTMSRLLRTRRPVPARTLLAVARGLRMSPAEITEFRAQEDAVAVIDAIRRNGFRPDCRWLASITGLRIDQINIVLQRLLRIGALRMQSASHWEVSE